MTTYIHTATWKTHPNPKSPDPITKDSRGKEIVVGAKVAYNFSGAVAMGTITAIKNNVWKNPNKDMPIGLAILNLKSNMKMVISLLLKILIHLSYYEIYEM